MSKTYDLIVVGAGWFGLAAAKTYIELHPNERVLVIEAANTCGGTWSEDRLYPGLKSNNMCGSYEYPDFPMDESYGVKYGDHIPAATLHQYLTDFAKRFGVFERTHFNTKVDTIEPGEAGGWSLAVSSGKGNELIETKKLILATGLTSQPNLPTYAGQETFKPPLFHAKDFCIHGDTVKTSRRAVVVGAGKSAYDCAYAFATEGAQVDLVVRPTGQGPVWICPPYVTPFKRMMEELLNTRCLTWFSPCPWGGEDGFSVARKFLHGTAIGRLLVDNYWNKLSSDVIDTHGYHDDPNVFKLKPWNSAMWTGSGVGIHNYPTNLFDLVKEGKIKVHIADITRLDGNRVILSDGETLTTDVLICATGWKKESTIKFPNLKAGMGLAHSALEVEKLSKEADEIILTEFPSLKAQPVLRFERKSEQPLRNYRFIVPAGRVFDRNIAFAGMASTVSTAVFATAQALWITAFFDDKLKRMPKNDDEVTKEVMLHTGFGKWRYPCGYGASLPDFAFDALPYVDLLLNDLGLKNHRKATKIAELTEPYKPRDYRGLTDEWIELQRVCNGMGRA
ncbi:putative dimethylaniline monooxygenase [Dactylonectria macrodidyma]|uniref:Dimethylaniline monooxygenase n=1 Tax=Dactylonectria macrodidyma TaxID=307937 RepID=A0A9P9EQR4_9HYPO|nr:putative dimethylaniline monooxygenase [Dactylonectria macrodidyma]